MTKMCPVLSQTRIEIRGVYRPEKTVIVEGVVCIEADCEVWNEITKRCGMRH